ncbi:MAG: HU family DNA-binding protein [Candidatus Neomarinimicrobiota bacterium]|jgi:nucleoid DNA-binding protein|nr:HU family DNA-binding protein [Candidatus Neomarinimicrobiota bacterium]|tara:strand:- start:915 stop:1223 length:309 start_codon:yes stop_codon:yes gene_type:complete
MRIITYTKRDIAARLGNKLGISTRKSLVYTDEVFNVLRDILCQEKPYIRIEVRNFGVLESKPTKAKPKARNPKTNEEIFVPAHKKTRFKPGKILKEYLRKPI